MTPWWVLLLISIASLIIGIVVGGVWEKSKKWPFAPELLREHSHYAIISPNKILSLSACPYGRKALRLEKILPSEYLPTVLQIKCYQGEKSIFYETLIANMAERGIMCGSNLVMSMRKPLCLEIQNTSNLNQRIRLNFFYKGPEELLVLEV